MEPTIEATAVDASQELAIHANRVQAGLALLAALAFVVAGVTGAMRIIPNYSQGFAYFTAAFGVVMLVAWLPQAFRLREPALVFTPESVRDARSSPDAIPWSEVEAVEVWRQNSRNLGAHLVVAKAFEQTYRRYGLQKLFGVLNRAGGYRGIWLSAFGTELDAPTLHQICVGYWRAYQARSGSQHV